MEMRKLGRTGVNVSAICLGTMTWGEQNSEAEGHAQMDYAVDQGVNFFDTAELYPIPPKAGTKGRTEEIIGTWFAARKRRDKIVLATKVVGRSQMTHYRKNRISARLDRAQIIEAVEGSLARLKTDYIDLFQVHWPDRPVPLFAGLDYVHREAETIPIEETLAALGELVTSGKIRFLGISNETPWGTMSYLKAAEALGLPRIVSIQNAYNLVNRAFEVGLSEIAHRETVGLLAYSPLAQGYLTGKYQDGALPPNSRKALFGRMERYETPTAASAMARYFDIARKFNMDPAQMALQFISTRPFVTSSIIGATNLEQLKTNIESIQIDVPEAMLREIDETHLIYSNPCP